MEIQMFLESAIYKEMKISYEKKFFKLFGSFCQQIDYEIIERIETAIKSYFTNKNIEFDIVHEITNKKGDKITSSVKKIKSFFDVWTYDPNIIEYETITFKCDKSLVKSYEYNMFKWFNHFDNLQKPKVQLDEVYEHIKSLVNYNESHFNYLLDWFAQLVQYPHIKPHTCLIFISEEGVGKDIFIKFISNVINLIILIMLKN